MKIAALKIVPVEFPFTCPFGTPYTTRSKMSAVVVLLETDAGARGESVLIAAHGKRLRLLYEMVASFEPLVVGFDLADREDFLRRARRDASHIGSGGVIAIGIGALEGALLDLAAKDAGLPVHRLLGTRRNAVRTYYSSGFWPHVALDELLRTAERAVAGGHRALKIRIGALSPQEDVQRVEALRECMGAQIEIMADVGRRLDEETAIRLCEMLSPYELTWIEEPLAGHDYAAHARVAAASRTPIALGESVFSQDEFAEIMQKRAARVIMPDLQRIGGPSAFLDVARLAQTHGLDISSHVAPEMTFPLLLHVENPGYLEIMPWASPLYRGDITVKDGYAQAADTPGWGLAICEKALARYTLS